ncbi:MAG: calcium-binding protein, partial [Kiloniellales bacterium]
MTDFTRTSPTSGGEVPLQTTEYGGIVIDLIGLNGARVVAQLTSSGLFAQNSTVTGGRTIGTQSGLDPALIAALGGGLSEVAVRVTLYDGDTSPGNFDFNDMTLLLNGVTMQNMSDLTTQQTNADGTSEVATFTGFPNGQTTTGWFYSDDSGFLNSFFATLGGGSVAYSFAGAGGNALYFNRGIPGGFVELVAVPIEGTSGNDSLVGDTEPDLISGLSGSDSLYGVSGPDIVSGGSGDDNALFGGSGPDRVFGGLGDDAGLYGGPGDDVVAGDEGDDTLFGDEGDDSLDGGSGADRAYGGDGDDSLLASSGTDPLLAGGSGDDVFRITSGLAGAGETLDGGSGSDTLVLLNGASLGGAELTSVEVTITAFLGTSGNDSLVGTTGQDLMLGYGGSDQLLGRAGDDVIYGGAGADRRLLGQGGDDSVFGGDFNDTSAFGGEGQDRIYGDAGADTSFSGGGSNDYLFGGEGRDFTFHGDSGRD